MPFPLLAGLGINGMRSLAVDVLGEELINHLTERLCCLLCRGSGRFGWEGFFSFASLFVYLFVYLIIHSKKLQSQIIIPSNQTGEPTTVSSAARYKIRKEARLDDP